MLVYLDKNILAYKHIYLTELTISSGNLVTRKSLIMIYFKLQNLNPRYCCSFSRNTILDSLYRKNCDQDLGNNDITLQNQPVSHHSGFLLCSPQSWCPGAAG